MLKLEDINFLYDLRSHHTYPNFLKLLLPHIQELQYQKPIIIKDFCEYLTKQLLLHTENSPIYKDHRGIITKDQLQNQETWYVNGWPAAAAQTGGSTTGQRFSYRRWSETYQQIESDNHYRAILKEFDLEKPSQVLYLMLDRAVDRQTNSLTRIYTTNNIMISHGLKQQAVIHDVIRNQAYHTNYQEFYERLLEYLNDNPIDIILAPGGIITELTWNIKRLQHTAPICKLLSNTGSKVNRDDFDFLSANGNINNWCDHMRCWDGGVTFFTCRYHTRHLLDGLAWAYASEDRLISNDFYSLPSPFLNYWNGDQATIADHYKQCQCGRMYREFSIDRTRTVSLNGTTNRQICTSLQMNANRIKRIYSSDNFIRIFTKEPFSTRERQEIRKNLSNFEINFIIEPDL